MITNLSSDLTTLGNNFEAEVQSIVRGITGLTGTNPLTVINTWSTNLTSMLGGLNFNSGTFNPVTAVTSFINTMLSPSGLLAPLVSGLIPGGNIPGLDASKIISGQFITSLIPNLDASIINTGTFLAGLIPGTDASIINASRSLQAVWSPNLDASKIISGIMALARIPNLPTSIITSGQFAQSFLNITSIAGSIITGAGSIASSLLAGLDASKIISGTFAQSFVTGLPAALAAALTGTSPLNAQNLFNQVSSSLLGLVPFSHIGQANPNLIATPTFDSAAALIGNPNWTWDGTDGHTTNGSASAVANGTVQTLTSNVIQVAQGQVMTIGAWVKYIGLTATAGQNAIRVNVAGFLGSTPVTTAIAASIASPTGTTGGWTQVSGSYTIPSGIDNIVVQLQITADATAVTVKYDDASATKTQLMSGNWMSGFSGGGSTVIQDLQGITDNIVQAINPLASVGNTLAQIETNLQNIPHINVIGNLQAADIGSSVQELPRCRGPGHQQRADSGVRQQHRPLAVRAGQRVQLPGIQPHRTYARHLGGGDHLR